MKEVETLAPARHWRHEAGACLRLAMPLIIGQLSLIGMEVTDVVMAGHLSGRALAAVGLGVSLIMPVTVLFMGVCMAVSPMVAFFVGGNERARIAPYMAQTLWLGLVLGMVWWLFYLAAPMLFMLLDVPTDLRALASGYVRASAWGAIGACLMFILRFMFEGMGRTGPVMLVGIVGLLANALGNYVFMYGMSVVPALGAVGAGWGTALAFWAMAIAMAWFARRVDDMRGLGLWRALLAPRLDIWWQTLRLGVPVGVTLFLEAGLFGLLGLLMALFGGTAVAAYQIAANFSGLTFMLPLGIALATTARVGQAAGAGELAQARFRGFVGICVTLPVMLLPLILMGVFPYWVAGFYTADPRILTLAAGLLQLAVLFQFFDGLQVSAAGALRGYKDTRVPMVITLLAYWGVGLPLGWWLGFIRDGGPRGLWWALIGGLATAGILLLWRFHSVTLARGHGADFPATDY